MKEQQEDQYSDEVTTSRRDEVIKRMLNTPPQPRRVKQESKETREAAPKARSKRPS